MVPLEYLQRLVLHSGLCIYLIPKKAVGEGDQINRDSLVLCREFGDHVGLLWRRGSAGISAKTGAPQWLVYLIDYKKSELSTLPNQQGFRSPVQGIWEPYRAPVAQ